MIRLRVSAIMHLLLGGCLITSTLDRLDAQVPAQPPIIREIDVQFVGTETLSKQRVLTYRGNQIRISNRARLEKIASSDERI